MGGEGSGRKPDVVKRLIESTQPSPHVSDTFAIPNLSGDLSHGSVIDTPVNAKDPVSKEYVDAHVTTNAVTATNVLTDETLVQGDGGARGAKTSTVTAAEVADNTTARHGVNDANTSSEPVNANIQAHISDNTQAHTDYLINNGNDSTTGSLTANTLFAGLGGIITTGGGSIHSSGNITVTGTVDGIDIATDVAANTLKDTNVTTNLSLGAIDATTMIVASSDGTDATLIEADTTDAGLLGSAKWDEIVANTLKDTNVTTNITVVEAPTNVDIQSSDGTNDTIAAADVTNAGVMTTTMYDEHVVNTAHALDNSQAHTDYMLNTGDTATGDYNFDSNTLFVNSVNHKVGIGTVSPSEGIHVYHATENVLARIESGDTDVWLAFEDSNTASANKVLVGAIGDSLVLRGGGTNTLFIDANSNVGIGDSTPNELLELGSATAALSIQERAAAPDHTAAHGKLWVKKGTPCELWFTADDGTDTQIV